jgi:hypothetical protein
MSNTPPPIELAIEELLLHGFAPADRYRIAEAVQQELARLFASEGIPQALAQGGSIPWLDGGECELTQGMSAQAIGTQVARNIYGGLSGGTNGEMNGGTNA